MTGKETLNLFEMTSELTKNELFYRNLVLSELKRFIYENCESLNFTKDQALNEMLKIWKFYEKNGKDFNFKMEILRLDMIRNVVFSWFTFRYEDENTLCLTLKLINRSLRDDQKAI